MHVDVSVGSVNPGEPQVPRDIAARSIALEMGGLAALTALDKLVSDDTIAPQAAQK